jgi:NADH:ubiquinone oxidoreductase subunit 4 (subunit M)
MESYGFGDLTLLLAIPVIGALLVALLPRRQTIVLFSLALLSAGAAFLWSLKIFIKFDGSNGAMQLMEREAWMPSLAFNISSVSMHQYFPVLLTTLLRRWRSWLPGRCRTKSKSI